jgi:DNA-binding PadR family transcriptional regulator
MAATLRHVVRALVVERQRYGYEIANLLEERLKAYAWAPTGVYRQLDQLLHDDEVRFAGQRKGVQIGSRAAPRTVYEATALGRESHREWMLSPSPPTRVRQELDLKIQLATPEMLSGLIEQSWGQEQVCLGELAQLKKDVRPMPVDDATTWPEASTLLRRNGDIVMLEARIKVLQEARQVMQKIIGGRRI